MLYILQELFMSQILMSNLRQYSQIYFYSKLIHYLAKLFISLFIIEIMISKAEAIASESDSAKKIKNKKIFFISALGTGYAGGLFFLNHVWYANQKSTDFHFFNDGMEWNYMDKTGHLFFTYQISRGGNLWFKQAGFNEKKSLWWGGFLGAILLTPIEIFDGYSSGYGASGWDVLSNMGGSAWFISQELLFKKQMLEIKFSFRNSAYSSMRPEVLGRTMAERIIKDYNGQTYWFCFNLGDLSGENKESILNSLGLAIGYGAEGMIYGNNELNPGAYKKIYLAPDINLTKLPVRNATLKKILFYLNFYHLPLPALEYNQRVEWVWLWSQ